MYRKSQFRQVIALGKSVTIIRSNFQVYVSGNRAFPELQIAGFMMYLFGINNKYLMKNKIQVTNDFPGCFENVSNQNYFFEMLSNKAFDIWFIIFGSKFNLVFLEFELNI